MSFFPTTDPERLRQALAQDNLYFDTTTTPSPSRSPDGMDRDQASKGAWPVEGTSQQEMFPTSQSMSWTPEHVPDALSAPTQSIFEASYSTSESYSTSTSGWVPTSSSTLTPVSYPEFIQTTTLSQCYPLTSTAWDPLPSTATTSTTFVSDCDTSPGRSDYSTGSRHSIFESSPYADSDGFLQTAHSPYIKIEDASDYSRPRLYSVPGALPCDQPLHVNPGDIYSSPSLSGSEQHTMDTYSLPRKTEQEDFKPFIRPERPQRSSSRRALSEESRRASAEARQKRGFTTHANSTCHCEQCGKLFQRNYNLKAHMETHDPHRDQPHVCQHPGCRRRFVRRTDLLRHEQSVHLKDRKHGCPLCFAAFARKDTLRRHIDDGCPKRPEVKKRAERGRSGSTHSNASSLHYAGLSVSPKMSRC